MNKLTFSKGKAIVCLILMCLLLAQSCKKDLLLPKKTENSSTDKIRSISYSQFVSAIDLNSTGSLKAVLSGQKAKVMSTQALPGNLDLEMDSVKKLTLGDTISYVIAIKPQTSRSTAFQNLTIQVIQDKTTAFLSTYYPEKEWLDNWRKKLKTKFKGTIVFNKIYLEDISLNDKINTTGLANREGKLKDKLLATISGNSGYRDVISLAPGECEFYDVFTVVAYPCSTGDMPGHCPWESDGGLTMGMLDYLPGYRVDKNTVINCAMPNLPTGGGSSGGGGGSTTPNTPGTYNPCDGTPQPVGPGGISFERGTRLMVAAQTDCDEISGPPVITTTQTPQQYFINYFDPDGAELSFINNPLNGEAVIELSKYLIKNGSSIGNTNFIHWAIGHLSEDNSRFNQAFRDLLNGVYNEYSPIYMPTNFDVIYDQQWYDDENELGIIDVETVQQGLPNADPIPESYYIKGVGIDMTPATPRNGHTVHGNPRNAKYFWEQLIKKRPEMFSPENRNYIANNQFNKVNADDQWIKYNPTHKSYRFNQLVHHHHKQRNMAFAIPAKVHQKWTSRLHLTRLNLSKVKNRLNSMGPFMELFSIFTDIKTGNPDAWVNGFGATDEIGKLYKEPLQNFYFEIMEQQIFKNSSGTVTRAIVTYDAFEDYIWDEDERRYMGIFKIATYQEDIDVTNHRTNSLKKIY